MVTQNLEHKFKKKSKTSRNICFKLNIKETKIEHSITKI
jgi:hypothetical protein